MPASLLRLAARCLPRPAVPAVPRSLAEGAPRQAPLRASRVLPLLARVLKPGAEWRVASDDPTYQAWVDEVMAAQALFEQRHRQPTARGLAADTLRGKGAARGPDAAYWTFVRLEARAIPRP